MSKHSFTNTFRLFSLSCLILFACMGSKCQTDSAVILPQGPQAAQLSQAKDEQIKEQAKQIEELKTTRAAEQKQASLAAANFEGVLYGAEHVDPGLPRNAIEEEAKLGKARLPEADPQEVIKAKDRVIAILQNEIAKAKELYGKAFDEAAQTKAQLAQKDKELNQRDQDLKARDAKIEALNEAAKMEAQKHENDVRDLIAKKDKEKADLIREYESKERATWVLWTRIAGLGLIVVGALVMIVIKAFPEGGGLIGAGVIIGLVSIFIDWVTKQVWFPWAMGAIILGALVAGGYALYRTWKKHRLSEKKAQAIQDYIDEKTIKGDVSAAEDLKEHLTYRIGGKDSFWGKEQAKEVAELGLIDPKGEEIIKNQAPKVDSPKG